MLRCYEKQYCGKFLSIVATSKTEQKLLKDLKLETSVTIIPNGLDLSRFPKLTVNRGGRRIVFIVAMETPVNIDAARFFRLDGFTTTA
ncbi:MAG: hypothetical protein ACQJCO_08265 [cyanobacterium endosymbiont of Rhopalodia sterrenbergii]